MKDLEAMFRAFRHYRSLTPTDRASQDLRRAFLHAPTEGDALDSMHTYPEICEDWIEKIEAEMVYVEKAVREDRQFICQTGEVVPVEKAKRVSRESVKQLAHHSEQITHVPEDPEDDLVPEKIYIVENLSDYAVYENRFLYMLLCYTRDFITLRLNKILELGRTHKSKWTLEKKLNYNKRSVVYSFHLDETDTDAETAEEFEACLPLIRRIEDQQFLVMALLDTPLMQEVSKAPMIKPPITLTNVLKKNNNFKHALDLYHYLSSYTGRGYEIKENHTRYEPLPERMVEDAAEVLLIQSYLAYQYGNNLTDVLTAEYLAAEERRRIAAEEELRRHIEAVRRRYEETGEGLEEYIRLLEEHNHLLDGVRDRLNEKEAENAALLEECQSRREQIAQLQLRLDDKDREIRDLGFAHLAEMAELKEKQAQTTTELQAAHRARIAEKDAELSNLTEARDEAQAQTERVCEAMKLLHARLLALRQKHEDFTGVAADMLAQTDSIAANPADETVFTDEAGFRQLEGEFERFADFFFDRWAKTKRRVRRQILYVLPDRRGSVGLTGGTTTSAEAIMTQTEEKEDERHES